MGVWVAIIPVVVIAVIAYVIYLRSRHAKGELAPEETPDETQPPPHRDRTWDPHERYDDGEPPAAR